jgi:hypothetical protein
VHPGYGSLTEPYRGILLTGGSLKTPLTQQELIPLSNDHLFDHPGSCLRLAGKQSNIEGILGHGTGDVFLSIGREFCLS